MLVDRYHLPDAPPSREGPLPGQPDTGGKVAGEPELGVAKQTRSSNSFLMI
jgi:hypothetical protein